MKKVLVTGAGGFIGKPLVKRLRKSYEVFRILSRTTDVVDVETWSSYPSVNAVIHLAGCSFVPDSWSDTPEFIRTNVLGTVQALEYCRKYKARLVYISAYLYGIPNRLPISEDEPLDPNNPYALSKNMAESACEFYSKYWNIPVVVIRPFNVFGPGQRPDFLVSDVVHQVKYGSEIRVKDTKPKRDYVYVDDVVDALVKALNIDQGYNVFNIGTGKSYSVGEVINVIQEVAGTQLPVISENVVRQQEIDNVVADIKDANKLLGWSPRYSLSSGISELLKDEVVR